ncbi:MAG: hypothetical protein NZ518_01635, partial [Dehalococcoidia bacterium]|nr:hypothetical protein [Dehalococcoidia bacterium]
MLARLCAIAAALVFVGLIVGNGGVSSVADAQQPEDFALPNGRFFTQARGNAPAGFGFAVVDDGIQFFSAWRQLGGAAVVGFPISQRFTLPDGRPAQAFQQFILVWQPEAGAAQTLPTADNQQLIPPTALVPNAFAQARLPQQPAVAPGPGLFPGVPADAFQAAPPPGASVPQQPFLPQPPGAGVPQQPFLPQPPFLPPQPGAFAPFPSQPPTVFDPFLYPYPPGYAPFQPVFGQPFTPGCDPRFFPFSCPGFPMVVEPAPTAPPPPRHADCCDEPPTPRPRNTATPTPNAPTRTPTTTPTPPRPGSPNPSGVIQPSSPPP